MPALDAPGAIRTAHTYGLETPVSESTLRVGTARKKPLAANVVLVQARMRLEGQSPVGDVTRPGARRTVFSFVMRRSGDRNALASDAAGTALLTTRPRDPDCGDPRVRCGVVFG